MASSVRVAVHVVFATKDRKPMLKHEIWGELGPYLGGTLKALDCVPIAISGGEDHVHMLFWLTAKASLSEVVGKAKAALSKWIKQAFGLHSFGWQEGYAAFSVSLEDTPAVAAYIQSQPRRHSSPAHEREVEDWLSGRLDPHRDDVCRPPGSV